MVILEGKQGTYKSTLFNIIGGKFYSEATHDVRSTDFFKCLEGKMIIEFAELSAFSKSEVNLIKKIITCRSDRFRSSYGRLPSDHPRTSIFTGSTNDEEYLGDTTGARRFLPLKIDTIVVDRIIKDRDQLFAEAVALMRSGIEWWIFPDETIMAQEQRRIYDEWEESVKTFTENREVFTLKEVANYLGIKEVDLDMTVQKRIAKILQMNHDFRREIKKVNGKTVRCWVNKMALSYP
jgi:predicted P-loop ATPase